MSFTTLQAARRAAATITNLGGTLPAAVTDELAGYVAAAAQADSLAVAAGDLGEAVAAVLVVGGNPDTDAAVQAQIRAKVLAGHVDEVRAALDGRVAEWTNSTFRPACQAAAVALYVTAVTEPVTAAVDVLGAGPLTRYAGATGAAAAAVADVAGAEVAAAQLASAWAVGRVDDAEHDPLVLGVPADAMAYQTRDDSVWTLAGAGWDLSMPADDADLDARHAAAAAL